MWIQSIRSKIGLFSFLINSCGMIISFWHLKARNVTIVFFSSCSFHWNVYSTKTFSLITGIGFHIVGCMPMLHVVTSSSVLRRKFRFSFRLKNDMIVKLKTLKLGRASCTIRCRGRLVLLNSFHNLSFLDLRSMHSCLDWEFRQPTSFFNRS